MSPANILRTAWRGILSNKLRASLTMLGVIIGVASVIAMLSIGNGARAAVEASFRFLGSDEIQISTALSFEDGDLVEAGEKLTYADGLALPQETSLIDRVDMSVSQTSKVRRGGTTLDISVTGSTQDVLRALVAQTQVQPVGWTSGKPLSPEAFIGQGRFYTLEEILAGAEVCVLGYQTALDLFQGDDPLDQVVWVSRQRCVVIGVFTELETVDPSQRYTARVNDAFFMPISTVIDKLYATPPSVLITAHVRDEARMAEAKDEVSQVLRQKHNLQPNAEGEYEDDFTLTTKHDVLGAQQEAAGTFALLLAAMAAISLVVGGIGIMNVMLVSVTERTREIGIRMAIGARQLDIIAQFLLESVLISAGGGLLGVAAGVLFIPLAASFNNGQALLAVENIPVAFGVAVLTGLVFGLYPALRASRLDPIEALRYE